MSKFEDKLKLLHFKGEYDTIMRVFCAYNSH